MAKKTDIEEGVYFETMEGRIVQTYAVSNRNKEEGTVDLFFEGSGCVFAGENYRSPSGLFRVETLKLVKNKFFKVTVKDLDSGEEEISNRVEDVKKFKKLYKGRKVKFEVEKLSDSEFEETEL